MARMIQGSCWAGMERIPLTTASPAVIGRRLATSKPSQAMTLTWRYWRLERERIKPWNRGFWLRWILSQGRERKWLWWRHLWVEAHLGPGATHLGSSGFNSWRKWEVLFWLPSASKMWLTNCTSQPFSLCSCLFLLKQISFKEENNRKKQNT